MALEPRTTDDTVSANDSQFRAALDRLWAGLPRLRTIALAGDRIGQLADHVAALRFLLHAGTERPLIVALVGGASCGKSTLFNSLVGRRLSCVHYQPHSSLGPILFAHRRHRTRLLPQVPPRRFLPEFAAAELASSGPPATGSVDAALVACHDDQRWEHLAIFDLPDITSESARREGWLVRRLLPWMDLIIWMVDPNDYLFEDSYVDLIEEATSFGQRSIVVVNDIHGQVDSGNSVLRERIARFQPDAWFVLPPLLCSANDPYPLFRSEPGFIKLRDFLLAHRAARPLDPLLARVRRDAANVLHANAEWLRLTRELANSLDRMVARHRKRILAAAPVLSVLPGPAREELERLRNRLSIWHQGKRLFQTLRNPTRIVSQAVRRQFQMTQEDIDTEPLYRHLVGSLKEFGVELHRAYLESRLVAASQEWDSRFEVLGTFDPESLEFRAELGAVAQHVFRGSQDILGDPSLLKDPRLRFAGGSMGVVLAFFLVESLLGLPGVSTLVGGALTGLAGVLSPELARFFPMDRLGRLAREARDMLAAILDRRIRRMVEFYSAAGGRYLNPGDPLLTALEELLAESVRSANGRPTNP